MSSLYKNQGLDSPNANPNHQFRVAGLLYIGKPHEPWVLYFLSSRPCLNLSRNFHMGKRQANKETAEQSKHGNQTGLGKNIRRPTLAGSQQGMRNGTTTTFHHPVWFPLFENPQTVRSPTSESHCPSHRQDRPQRPTLDTRHLGTENRNRVVPPARTMGPRRRLKMRSLSSFLAAPRLVGQVPTCKRVYFLRALKWWFSGWLPLTPQSKRYRLKKKRRAPHLGDPFIGFQQKGAIGCYRVLRWRLEPVA